MSKKRNPPGRYHANDTFEPSADDWDETIDDIGLQPSSAASPAPGARHRDWRDAERYREERELRRQLEEAAWFDELESGPGDAARR